MQVEPKTKLEGWLNKPDKVVTKEDTITVRVPKQTVCPTSAPFCYQTIRGDFQISVKISGTFASENDQAGIMLRLDDNHWILTGLEYCNGQYIHSTSVALLKEEGQDQHPIPDWSGTPLPETAQPTTEGVWFCFKRVGNAYECFYSLDARKWIQTRQGLFLSESSSTKKLFAGVSCACPNSKDGFQVSFDSYACTDKFI